MPTRTRTRTALTGLVLALLTLDVALHAAALAHPAQVRVYQCTREGEGCHEVAIVKPAAP